LIKLNTIKTLIKKNQKNQIEINIILIEKKIKNLIWLVIKLKTIKTLIKEQGKKIKKSKVEGHKWKTYIYKLELKN
jgi:hypothetical protein